MGRWIHEMKWPEVAEYLRTDDTVIIPAGTTEQHGPHLPLMVDAIQAIDVAVAVADRTGVLLSPPLWYGWSPHHMGFPGTITLGWDTVVRVVEDIAYSLVHHGFKKLIFIQARGGHMLPFQQAQVRIRNRTNCYMAIVDIAYIARKEVGAICDGVAGAIGHACEAETSHMLYLHPEFVDMSKAVNHANTPDPRYAGSFSITNPYLANMNAVGLRATIEEFTKRVGPAGVEGEPLRASKEKGQKIFEAVVANTIEIVERAKKQPVVLRPVEVPL